ncbi:YybH family protein [Spongiimicrobium salis]|uniref:YybH family protein n=1 Tax=Spongiimicrobium salis TaxID=1667022 RepID=UPI00374DB64F
MNAIAKDEIRKACQDWMDAFNSHDIDQLMSLYDPEASYSTSGGPRRSDLETIKQGFIEHFMVKPHATIFEEQVIAGRDVGYYTGNFIMKGTHPEDGTEMLEKGRVVVIFRKSPSGTWKLVFDMDNRPPDVQ